MDSPPLELTARDRRQSLIAIVLHMLGIGIAFGASIPLTSLVLERWGEDAGTIGLVGALPTLANVLLLPALRRLAAQLGTGRAMVLGCGLAAVSIAVMPLLPALGSWALLRFLAGAGLALPWLIGETWINAVALSHNRGRIIAVYSSALFVGFAIGPSLLTLVGTEGRLPFLVIGLATALAVLPLLPVLHLAPPLPLRPGLRLSQVARRAPTMLLAGMAAGFAEFASFSLLPVFGVRNGLAEPAALLLLTVFLVGGILLQLPLGWLGDRWSRRPTLALAGLLGLACALALGLAGGDPLAAGAVCFLLGGAVLALYNLGLALLGERFDTADLGVANAAFIMVYSAGSLVGPAVGGLATELSVTWGLPGTLAAICLIVVTMALWRERGGAPARRRGRSE
ncbi:Predicted arabinose efflux permease, MFS family [Tistlia consotensis]|uniref:Predicted arabinose efflux permease, MFS family n=1 Tax=Tistlia consotensis USBA 355 TaxID=560819 RepID=A0A1Y6B8D4_9PROT|nr:MFS transporter [Tistlia consotensis]SME89702.1 Predicted arabinose efflux permease, MFS family [Tistlia consotensis USBA 355]SNR26216.1 Predicted arabinose efflux permease, MFS family [Tistlia consotensis]